MDTRGIGGIHGLADEGEDIRVFTESPDTALQWLALNRGKLRREWLGGDA